MSAQPGLTKALETVGLVIAPSATLTGLLLYFGWVRTNAIFGFYGIDTNLLAYGPQDYLLRSAGVAFRPCAALLGATIAGLIIFVVLRHVAARRAVLIEVALAGATLTAAGGAVLFGRAGVAKPLTAAASLVAGVVLVEFAVTLWPFEAVAGLRRGAVAGVVAVGLFWAFAVHAQSTGERVAQSLVAGRPIAAVHSKADLGLTGPGVTVTRTTGTFPYQYEGLRLFIYRDKRWFLLPAGWQRDNHAAAIILPDSDGIRVELRP